MANRGVGPKFAEGTASAPSGESKQAKQSDLARNFAARELIRSEVKLQAGVQLPPITQRLVFYEGVETESQALEQRRRELMNKLATLTEKRKEVEAKWDQFQEYMKGKQPELDASKLRQFKAKKKAMEEQRDIRLLDEELATLRSEFAGLVKRRRRLHEKIRLHKPFEDYMLSVAKDGSKTFAMQSGGYGSKTAGQLVMDRYNTLAVAKEEATEKHHMQLQEVQSLQQSLKQLLHEHGQYVSLCNTKIAQMQRKLEHLLRSEHKVEESHSKRKEDFLEKYKIAGRVLRGVDSLYHHCTNNGVVTRAVHSPEGDSVDSKLKAVKEHLLYLEDVVQHVQASSS